MNLFPMMQMKLMKSGDDFHEMYEFVFCMQTIS